MDDKVKQGSANYSSIFGFNDSTVATSPVGDTHICNCIGCCKECGMCRTHPRHTSGVCQRLAAHDAERHRIIYGD